VKRSGGNCIETSLSTIIVARRSVERNPEPARECSYYTADALKGRELNNIKKPLDNIGLTRIANMHFKKSCLPWKTAKNYSVTLIST